MKKYLAKKYKQFLCLHKWRKGLPIDLEWGKGYLYKYHCTHCDKNIERWTGNEPISGILPENPWEIKRNPYTDMSPPIIRLDD